MNAQRIAQLAKLVEKWFRTDSRDLPWRRQRDAYSALVAEAMLQQTQVERVVERFEHFLDRFPTVQSLAAADQQEVLAAWQGLGYYRRARHLHEAARIVVEEHAGHVPLDVASLVKLPGVGRYTAGAIASIVGEHCEPIVDGNVHRVLARIHADRRPASDRAAISWAWAESTKLVEASTNPGVLNEGLMELGATVCTPRKPKCENCPLTASCAAFQTGEPEKYPQPKRAIERTVIHHHAVLLVRKGRLLVEQRPEGGLWSGMWQAPTLESQRALAPGMIRDRMPFRIDQVRRAGEFRHDTTHRRVEFHVFHASTRRRLGEWRSAQELQELPMSNAHRKVVKLASGILAD